MAACFHCGNRADVRGIKLNKIIVTGTFTFKDAYIGAGRTHDISDPETGKTVTIVSIPF